MQIYEPTIFVRQIPVGPMMNFAYLVGAFDGDEAVLIDPSWDAKKLLNSAEKDNRKIVAILATHSHFDHVNALENVVKKLGIPVYAHENELSEFPQSIDLRSTDEGTVIELAGVKISCLHTPGHTPGSQCFLVENAVFTGDTMFVDGCGRVDLEGGDPQAMVKSLTRLSELPENVIVFAGHDYGSSQVSTIGEQRERNPYLRAEASALL
jgi:glyoxylase-like metal-dependent hydrolase (beta-lactamase superfamily II)